MVNVHQIMVKSIGFAGAPGFTSFHFTWDTSSDTLPQYDAVKGWLDDVKVFFPDFWHAQIQPSSPVMDQGTGELQSFTDVDNTNGADVQGTASQIYGAGVAGLVQSLRTNTVNRARKVHGRIFLVPLASLCYQADGTLNQSIIDAATAAGQALIDADVNFGVWSRPRAKSGGLLCPVTGVRVNDKAAFLSSRRG